MDRQIICFGDSIVYGAWDSEGGWANRLKKRMDQNSRTSDDYCVVFNLGISGNTTSDILKRMGPEMEARSRYEETFVIVGVGANDAAIEDGNFWIDEKQFRQNLVELISNLKGRTDRVLFILPSLPDDSKTNPIPWRPLHYTVENVANYASIMKEVCEGHGVDVLDPALEVSDFSEDGLHPNSSGHEKIFLKVLEWIDGGEPNGSQAIQYVA